MSSFLQSMFNEVGARRRRLRKALGERGQPLTEALVLGGLVLGSLGLFLGEWMPAVAPWGFAVPILFALGFGLIEARRQAVVARGADSEVIGRGYDWIVLLWSLSCALLGAAAFAIAWTSRPEVPEETFWTPPEDAVTLDIPQE
jgi:hypothetical protein